MRPDSAAGRTESGETSTAATAGSGAANETPSCISSSLMVTAGRDGGPISMARTVGIDLGTTNSVVAILEGGEPTVIANCRFREER
jgi:hypothetical protein